MKQNFRQVFRMDADAWLHGSPLQKAAHLLRNTRIQVNKIAQLTGYENHQAFTVAFKSRYGIAPRAYRCGEQSEETERRLLTREVNKNVQ